MDGSWLRAIFAAAVLGSAGAAAPLAVLVQVSALTGNGGAGAPAVAILFMGLVFGLLPALIVTAGVGAPILVELRRRGLSGRLVFAAVGAATGLLLSTVVGLALSAFLRNSLLSGFLAAAAVLVSGGAAAGFTLEWLAPRDRPKVNRRTVATFD